MIGRAIGRIYAIALTTFREAVRQRVLYGVVAVVFLINLFAIVLGLMSYNEETRVARDVGLSGVSLFGAFTAIYIGVSLLYGEIQRRTIYPIITKPLARWEFVLGKYLGMCATLTLLVAAFAIAMALLLTLQQVSWTAAVSKALVLAYVEVLIVAAVAIFFSSFSSPFLSGIFTFVLFFLGRVTPELRAAVESGKSAWIRTTADIALYVVPDLHLFKVSGRAVGGEHVSVHGEFVDWSYVVMVVGYGGLWIAALLALAVVIFSRRNFA